MARKTGDSLIYLLSSFSVNAFGPRAFLKREDQSVSESASAAKPESLAGNAQADEKMTAAETKRFEPENFYGAGLQAKRFEQTDGYYEQPWVAGPYPQQKRFDYFLDGYYGGGPAVAPMARYNK